MLETMTLTTYLLYLAAVALLVLSPGPTMLMSITNAIGHGSPKAISSAAGSVTAVLGVMLLSSFGLGALLAASDTAFNGLKICGAAYLIYLGIKTFCSPVSSFDLPPGDLATQTSKLKFFSQGLLVGASNPKAILFFTAFFPQFLDTRQAWAPQFALLAGSFIAFELGVLSLCCVFAARIAPWLRQQGRAKVFNRISGSLFAGMGGLLLAARK